MSVPPPEPQIGRLDMGQKTLIADPIGMLFSLLTDPTKGIVVTADDGVTVLSPRLVVANSAFSYNEVEPGALLYVKQHPYPQAYDTTGKVNPSINVPLVIVGPAQPVQENIYGGYGLVELRQNVQIQVITRDWDDSQSGDFTVSGNLMRRKILQNIESIVRANKRNPLDLNIYTHIVVKGRGRDDDTPVGKGEGMAINLYVSSLFIECLWYQD
jgi:hypothetical protein